MKYCCFWFGCALACEQSIYDVYYDYVVLSIRSYSKLCMKYVPFQLPKIITKLEIIQCA